ncbi:hypothetical protein PENSPDRAFT_655785 [Peniophora sp. CONT]|nr:hypothetical protein PENSPDRAFT_655785 [Peniophora sp. CONT]
MEREHEHNSDSPPPYIRFSPTVALLQSPPSPAVSILACSSEKEPSSGEEASTSRCTKDRDMHSGYQAAALSGFAELVHLVMSTISTTPPSTPNEEIPAVAPLKTARFGIAELTLSLMYPDLTFFDLSPPVYAATASRKRTSNLAEKEHEWADKIYRWNVHVHCSLGRHPGSPFLP